MAHSLQDHPLAALLDEFVQQYREIGQDEPKNVEAEELGDSPGGEFEAVLRRVGVLEPRIFDLSSNLVCASGVSKTRKKSIIPLVQRTESLGGIK
jgi:hypothetical protein